MLLLAAGAAAGNTVRLITSRSGDNRYEVSTLAGQPGVKGMRDGPGDQALLSAPHAVAWEADGSLLVVDIGNARSRRIRNGIMTTVVGGEKKASIDGPGPQAALVAPIDLTFADESSVLIADIGASNVRRWTADQDLQTAPQEAELNRPHGIAAANGLIYIAEIGGHKIVSIRQDGRVDLVAGTGTAGSGTHEVDSPAALLFHAERLWIADLGNHRILTIP